MAIYSDNKELEILDSEVNFEKDCIDKDYLVERLGGLPLSMSCVLSESLLDEDSLEKPVNVRAATMEDIDSLVMVEYGSYRDVYGDNPSTDTLSDIRDKYEERITLLGDWIRVLEHPDAGVYGMVVVCPTNLEREDFEARDMTQNDFIKDAYDKDGKNVYVVNLAILPNEFKGNRLDLFASGISLAVERGVQYAYFESRLPGLAEWALGQSSEKDLDVLDEATMDMLAEEYWQLTAGDGDDARPVDGLLSMYVDFGCKPIKLVKEAWSEDTPSKAYGVLCEFKVPYHN